MADEAAAPAANGALTQLVDAPPSPVELAEAITASAADATAAVAPADAPPVIVDKQPMGYRQRHVVGGSLVASTALLMTQLLAIWPAVSAAAVNPTRKRLTPLLFGVIDIKIDPRSC
jgi:hypothetical protein